MNIQSLLWRIGGAQGHGIDSAASLFARTCAGLGYPILGRREYHSNIMGRHSYADVRLANKPISGHCSISDFLICLDAESLCRHIHTLTPQACIVLDTADKNVEISALKFLNARIKKQLHEGLQYKKQPVMVADIIAGVSSQSLTFIELPFASFRQALQDKFDVPRSLAARNKNIAIVAASAALLNIPEVALTDEISVLFSGKDNVIELACMTIRLTYEYIETAQYQCPIKLPERVNPKEARLFISGYQSVALGKLAAGMGMQTYYPISPATDESQYLESLPNMLESQDDKTSNNVTPLVIQTEDELAAITMACGAALTGARVATSTSGPGFSLMVEGLGWAGMNEVPVVISLYQRGGPSTGMPTRTEQGDLQFVLHAGHGEFPRMVLASGDVEECFYDAYRAFNYAERYQLPVIQMLDKNIASTTQTLAAFNMESLVIDRGETANPSQAHNGRIARFKLNENGLSARAKLGEKDNLFWSSGVEHNEWGQVSEDPQIRQKMLEKRAHKLKLAAAEIPYEDKLAVYGDKQAGLSILSWGSNKGVIVEAVDQLNTENKPVRAIMIKLLWPFPVAELNKLIKESDILVVVECNQSGQFNSLLKAQIGREADHLLLKYSGRPFMLEDVLHHLSMIMAGQAEKIISVDDI